MFRLSSVALLAVLWTTAIAQVNTNYFYSYKLAIRSRFKCVSAHACKRIVGVVASDLSCYHVSRRSTHEVDSRLKLNTVAALYIVRSR